LDKDYERFLSVFGEIVGASADAVGHQIRFALPVTGHATWEPSMAYTAILNLAAAMQNGFITAADLPKLEATMSDAVSKRPTKRELRRPTITSSPS
jgi:hypothetical protein